MSGLLKQAFSDWQSDNAPRLGAALSYYTLFSLAPLLIVAIGVAGLAFGQEAARGRIMAELHGSHWVYYAAQIFFFGAELTQAYARRQGSWSPSVRGTALAAKSAGPRGHEGEVSHAGKGNEGARGAEAETGPGSEHAGGGVRA